MSTFFGINSSAVSTLFSSASSAKSGTTDILSDYYSIRNGSYKKLLNAYYSIDDNKKTKVTASTSTSSDTTKTLSAIKSSTDALKESADALLKTGSKSLFKTDASGKYDVDSIYKAVDSFVKNYNEVIDSTEESNTKNIANTSLSMMTSTKINANSLSKIGITIDKDGKLSLDEKTFKEADMGRVKSLFNGNGSFGYLTSARASMINYYASSEATKSNTYTGSGTYTYNYSAGDMINKLY